MEKNISICVVIIKYLSYELFDVSVGNGFCSRFLYREFIRVILGINVYIEISYFKFVLRDKLKLEYLVKVLKNVVVWGGGYRYFI